MKILVTGGAGFIGSNLVELLLQKGHSVEVLDDFNEFYSPQIKRANVAGFARDVPIHETDVRDFEAVRRVFGGTTFDAVIHLAARAGVRPSIQDPELYINTNVNGTFHMLEAARAAGVPRFILASSSSVYGVLTEVPFRETLCVDRTISPYAATKLACEQLGSTYAHVHGMRVVALRFFTVYGKRQRPDLAIHKFTRQILSGQPIDQFGDGSSARDYTYIDDILTGVYASLTYDDSPFEIFNLGEQQTVPLHRLISLLEKCLGKKAEIRRLPMQQGDVPATFADITKARKLLGYNPSTPIEEGLPKFIEWFRTTYPS